MAAEGRGAMPNSLARPEYFRYDSMVTAYQCVEGGLGLWISINISEGRTGDWAWLSSLEIR